MRFFEKFNRAALFATRYAGGELAKLLGWPIKHPATVVQAITQWLKHLTHQELPRPSGRILITALRNPTWIEWAIYCAFVIRKLGFESTLIFSSRLMQQYYSPHVLSIIARIPGIELVDLDVLTSQMTEQDFEDLRPIARNWATATLAYDLHNEEGEILRNREVYEAQLMTQETTLARSGAALRKLLTQETFDRFFCFSGLIDVSPILLHVAKAKSLRTVCIEGWAWRPGHQIYNFDSPALEYNVEGWMKAMEWTERENSEMATFAAFLDGHTDSLEKKSKWLGNFVAVQPTKADTPLPPALSTFIKTNRPLVLLAPNVVGDSSTIRRETIFSSQREWVAETIEITKKIGARLIIRAHPAEAIYTNKITVQMGAVARELAKNHDHVYVLDCYAKVNTFALLPHIRFGIVWLSSAGVDFVVRGTPTIAAARPKYAGLGIVDEPRTKTEYQEVLEKWASHLPPTRAESVAIGKKYQHMAFKTFSFHSWSTNYRATGAQLDSPENPSHDEFYRIITGLSPRPDLVEPLTTIQAHDTP